VCFVALTIGGDAALLQSIDLLDDSSKGVQMLHRLLVSTTTSTSEG
jgi:hypothetical protein